jgi:hypothetical protein
MSKTTTPLTIRVGVGASRPRRTSSDAALPSASERLSAYYRSKANTSSSRLSVVLIFQVMPYSLKYSYSPPRAPVSPSICTSLLGKARRSVQRG